MLVAMLLLFTIALALTTIDRLRRTNELMQESLALRGNLLVEYMETATRTSLRGSGARAVLLADLVQEISSNAKLGSLIIMDEHGKVMISLNKGSIDPQALVDSLSEEEWNALKEDRTFTVMTGDTMLLGRRFQPFSGSREAPYMLYNSDHHNSHLPGLPPPNQAVPYAYPGQSEKNMFYLPRRGLDQSTERTLDPGSQPWENMARLCLAVSRGSGKLYALVELSSQEVRIQSKRDLHSALLLAGIIFIGCTILAVAFTWLVRYRSREIQNLRRTMAENQHLAAVGRLAAAVAHEVRNPLSSLRGLVQLLGKNYTPGSKESNYAQVAVDEVDRLERVVSDLLNYSRPRTPRFLELDAGESIMAVLSFIKDDPRAKEVNIHCDIAKGLPTIPGDPDLMRQVLLNLIINALEAMNGQGNLWITAKIDESFLVVQIKDNGPGLPEGVDVFDPFFSDKPQGSGLGLAIARNIVMAHQGSLDGYNAPEGGAVMEIKLRLKQ